MFWWKQKNEKQKHFELNAALRSIVHSIQTNKKANLMMKIEHKRLTSIGFDKKRVKMWWTFIISFAFEKISVKSTSLEPSEI